MKLILAIIHDEDALNVMDKLNTEGYSVTKLCSTGGFLKSGNTTLLIGTEEDKVNSVIDIIEKKSKSRKKNVPLAVQPFSVGGVFTPDQVAEVVVGSATIFVMDIEKFEKV